MSVSNLTNTKWVIESTPSISNNNLLAYNINFTSNSNNYTSFSYQSDDGLHIYYGNSQVYWGGYTFWDDEAYRIIEITGGTDVTNSALIQWLEANATYQEPIPVRTFDLSTLQLSAGTHTIQVRARGSGYRDSNFSNSVSYEAGKWSCVVAGLGSENPSNVTFTHTGTMPTFEEVTVNSNVFIKIPKMYRKVLATSNNQITSFEIANYKKDNNFVPYTCFVKEDGSTEMDYVLIGKNDYMTATLTNARTNARALGSGYQLYDWQIHKLWQDLIICKKNTIDTNNGSGIGTNGYDEFGIYWGTAYWWIDGILTTNGYNSSSSWGRWKFSYKPSEYASASETAPSSYIQASYSIPTSTNEIQKLGYDSSNPFFNYPSAVTNNNNFNTYYCDRYDYVISNNIRQVNVHVGGSGNVWGTFYCSISDGWSATRNNRLCYRPIDGSTN